MRVKLHGRAPAFTLALASLAALLLAPASASAETYWLDGYELEVALAPVRPSFVVGETVDLRLAFGNRSDAEVRA